MSRKNEFTRECSWCGVEMRARDFANHGEHKPQCVDRRSRRWMYDHGYRWPGRDTDVLRHAGVVKQLPFLSKSWGGPVPGKHGVEYTAVETVMPSPIAPQWACTMARRLMEDQALITKLGCGHKSKRVGTRGARRRVAEGLPADYILVIPIQLRAKIIRAAASSAMTQAMFEDDGLEAAIILIRDLM